jgi:hypothetical protein
MSDTDSNQDEPPSLLNRKDFNTLLGIVLTDTDGNEPSETDIAPHTDIVSDAGIETICSVRLSTCVVRDALAFSPIFQNPSPSYDQARGLVYDIFATYLELHTELLTLLHSSVPSSESGNVSNMIH